MYRYITESRHGVGGGVCKISEAGKLWTRAFSVLSSCMILTPPPGSVSLQLPMIILFLGNQRAWRLPEYLGYIKSSC